MAAIWTVVKVFEESVYGVEVSHSVGRYDESIYSVRAGRFVDKETSPGVNERVLMPFMRIERDRQVFSRCELRAPFAEILTRLLTQAEQYVLEQLSAEHAERLEERRGRELEDEQRGRPKTRRTGKTERDRERRRQRV